MKRGELRRGRIRTLAPSEPDPDGDPKRYTDRSGYVRLRWKVGPYEYVERYERAEGGAIVRTRPRQARRLDSQRIVTLYQAGRSTPQIAEELGCNAAAVSRVLARAGVQARHWREYAPELDTDEAVRLYVGERKGLVTVARTLGTSTERLRRVLRQAGVQVRRPGSPGKAGDGSVTYETEFDHAKPLVRARSGDRCEARVEGRCRERGTHVHHRKLRSQGGDNSLANLLHVCLPCHAWLHGNPAESYRRGLLVRGSDDPALVPVA